MKKILFFLPLLLGMAACQEGKQPQGAHSDVPVKNVIYLIGDGMGLAHLNAAMIESEEPMALERAQYVGLQKTTCTTNKVTDSAASGTALATGTKTYYGAIGVGPDTARLTSILEKAAANGLATGLVATYRITDATPAAFIAHVKHRSEEEEIAAAFFETPIDVFIGGGRARFEQREDGRNLSQELKEKGYQVVYTMEDLAPIQSGKIAGLMHEGHLPRIINGRDPDYLLDASLKTLDILSQNDKGFFVMIEGSQIDGGGHANNIEEVITETYDFDKVVKATFDFADANPGTLVVVTADHETGGLTLPAQGAGVRYHFSTGGHTGVMVPIYSYGAGAENFTGIMENTEIPIRMMELLGL
ncbi:MAG: alkaline phosphatase [Rikenellaceae bacterium]|nr:alkaline phosphatase [Rikenellaceae bacterium]